MTVHLLQFNESGFFPFIRLLHLENTVPIAELSQALTHSPHSLFFQFYPQIEYKHWHEIGREATL